MKLYGYKFLSTGGEYSSGIDLRFFAFVAAFICGAVVYAIDGDGFSSFVPLALVYFILGIGLEFFPKTSSVSVFIFALVISILIIWHLFTTVGECIEYCYVLREWHSRRGIESAYNTTHRASVLTLLVIGYNSLMAYLAYLSSRKKVPDVVI